MCLLLQVHHAKEQGALRKPLKVKFVGEEGVDEGGVQKEFFFLLVRACTCVRVFRKGREGGYVKSLPQRANNTRHAMKRAAIEFSEGILFI
jgi:hypothetical protein